MRHGKGFWEFNNSLLKDKACIECLNKVIDNAIQLAGIYLENVLYTDYACMQFIINNELFIETLLMEIRGRTISYTRHKAKETKKYGNELHVEILCMESN